MARERPGVSLGELHLEAMKLLVASLEKRKFAAGVTSTPRRRGDSGASQGSSRHIPAALRRCSAHNRLAAEQDFGQELMAARSDAARHESLWRQRVDDPGRD